jgi:hypothetical protein
MNEPTVSIRLELRLAEDVPEGVAFVEGGLAAPFAGWLGLMAAIETLTAQDTEEHAQC